MCSCFRNVKDKNFESDSQRANNESRNMECCFRNVKDKNFESDSQLSAFALHHHPTIIVCSCLSGAWLSVCLIKAINVATIVGVNITLCLFGVVVDCFHRFIVLCCLYFLFPFGYSAASGIMKLFVAVSILSAFPAIHANVRKLRL